ncbi:Pkinase-domain-containing protein [Fomitopsis betulina]|nr:Pkinase-domain-containing protein [Fomitopsis betulina]
MSAAHIPDINNRDVNVGIEEVGAALADGDDAELLKDLYLKDDDAVPISATPIPSRTVMPKQPDASESTLYQGLLTIRIFSGCGLGLAHGSPIPDIIQKALTTKMPLKTDNLQRRCWWLPYVILEFDKNEVLIDALGGDLASPQWNYKADFDVSRTSNIVVSAYLRTAQCVFDQGDMGDDLLVGRAELSPSLDDVRPVDQWYAATAGSGAFHLKFDFKPTRHDSSMMGQFDLLKTVGRGNFGMIVQVRKTDTQRIYALKSIRMEKITQQPGETTHILAERSVLGLVNNPFIVPLKFALQSSNRLYLVMPFVNGGELFSHHLQREGKFDEHRSRFYAAELLCALEHLHGFNLVYIDLKPENILLDYTGHLALCDFSLCRLNTYEESTFIPDYYTAPELLESRQSYTQTVDWWILGVLLYEMMTGLPPFYDENMDVMHQCILSDTVHFPSDMSHDAKTIMTGLLQRSPDKRLGANGAEDIKQNPFFSKHIDWKMLMAKKITPPFKPSVSVLDRADFASELTSEQVQDSHVDATLSETMQQ